MTFFSFFFPNDKPHLIVATLLKQVLTKPVDKQKSKDGKDKEIPIPEIRKVQSYEQDYRANYVPTLTYLRSEYWPFSDTRVLEKT